MAKFQYRKIVKGGERFFRISFSDGDYSTLLTSPESLAESFENQYNLAATFVQFVSDVYGKKYALMKKKIGD